MQGEEGKFCRLVECGKPLARGEGETKQNWDKRTFCNKSCSATWSRLQGKKGRGQAAAALTSPWRRKRRDQRPDSIQEVVQNNLPGRDGWHTR